MDRNQVRFALLKISCFVLVASTWIFSSFVLATRPQEQSSSDPLSSLVRLPASIPSQIKEIPGMRAGGSVRVAEIIAMDTVAVPCWDKVAEAAHDTSARWVRLTGKSCQGSGQNVTVSNLTNGYTATVFATRSESMTTDFIPLETGKNEIRIRFESEPGAHLESEVFFIRD